MKTQRGHFLLRSARIGIAFGLAAIAVGCGGQGKTEASRHSAEAAKEEYHADRDIAMTVSSIADAIRVGEPLDTLGYNFEGILTDGTGRPIYSDLRGAPGIWDVDVLNERMAVVSNLDLGDLLPEDLKNYLAYSLDLSDNDIIDAQRLEEGDEELEMVTYDLDGCLLRIETRKGMSASGIEAPLMRLTLSSPPN